MHCRRNGYPGKRKRSCPSLSCGCDHDGPFRRSGTRGSINNEIYSLLQFQKPGSSKQTVCTAASEFPALQSYRRADNFLSWQADGKTVHWSLGSTDFIYDVDKAQAFDDSVLAAKKIQNKKTAYFLASLAADPSLKKIADSLKKITDSSSKQTTAKKSRLKEEPKYKAQENDVKVFFKKDLPAGEVLLKIC